MVKLVTGIKSRNIVLIALQLFYIRLRQPILVESGVCRLKVYIIYDCLIYLRYNKYYMCLPTYINDYLFCAMISLNSTENAAQKQCVQDCQSSTEYDPVCGTDNITYINPEKFVCARNCGVRKYNYICFVNPSA